MISEEERFWSKVNKAGPDDCWEWQASRNRDGYGQLVVKGRLSRANRVAWKLTCGEIPLGIKVCHKCDNPPCCNPNHLFLGSQLDNMRDCAKKERNTAILSANDVEAIKKEYFSGEITQSALAIKYNVKRNVIHEIVIGRSRGWVGSKLENTKYIPRKKILPDQINQISEMVKISSLSNRFIAKTCGVSEATISLIRSGKRRLNV